MPEINPFASPQAYDTWADGQAGPDLVIETNEGLWREGKLLVMHRDAQLPDRCVKSNQPAHGRRLKRKLAWRHPAVFLLLLLHVVVYVIVAVILTKRATIYVGLSEEWFARRRRTIAVAWSLVLLGAGLVVVGIALVERNGMFGLLIAAGLVLALGAAIWGLVRARLVAPKRITADHVWLKGVHPAFLDELPHLPRAW